MLVWVATPVATDWRRARPASVAVLEPCSPARSCSRSSPVAPPPSEARALLAISAVTGFVLFPVVYTIGQERTSAMHGSMILAALPIITGLYAALVTRRRPEAWWLVGCGVALAGEAVIVALRAGASGEGATLVGDLLVLVSALAVAAGYVAGAMLLSLDFSSAATTTWGCCSALALSCRSRSCFSSATVCRRPMPRPGAQSSFSRS